MIVPSCQWPTTSPNPDASTRERSTKSEESAASKKSQWRDARLPGTSLPWQHAPSLFEPTCALIYQRLAETFTLNIRGAVLQLLHVRCLILLGYTNVND